MVAGGPVVGGDLPRSQERGPFGVGAVSEAHQRGRLLSDVQQCVLPDRKRRDPDAAAAEQRAAAFVGRSEADPEGARHPEAVSGPELA